MIDIGSFVSVEPKFIPRNNMDFSDAIDDIKNDMMFSKLTKETPAIFKHKFQCYMDVRCSRHEIDPEFSDEICSFICSIMEFR